MARVRITIEPSGAVLAERVQLAATIRARMKGLIGGPRPTPGAGLVLAPARQVHTFFMRSPIDVVFCDHDWRVLRVYRSLAPWRLTAWVRDSRYAIEVGSGTVGEDVTRGTQLSVAG